MAAVLNFFLPGLGHLVLGHLIGAVFWFLVCGVAYASAIATAGLGLLWALPVHLLCIVRGSSLQRRRDERSMEAAMRRAGRR